MKEQQAMFETGFTVEWGDCDEAGIVFYPNYFYWLDCTFQRFLRSHGLNQRELRKRFGAVTPIIQAHSDFKAPIRYDDTLVIRAIVRQESERRFRVDYHLSSNGTPVANAHEIRAWALVAADGSIKGGPIDPEFLAICNASDKP
ncbi:acyl-CoA thioesterase [Tardiphaga sp. OK245]|uniref:acyl-CoA thioesterase n=2 Tax=unclassified Tardiphaga TaxID=2631404 RepID=UPI00147F41F9|nr:acyl-CoA thioesterase [Tardiphaga sp. OK245]